jgi:signal transduction histidine kinase
LLDGVERVSKIVRAMKEFSHPGEGEKTLIDLHHAIETTITVARNEWKYVAEIQTDFDPSVNVVPGYAADLNQVFLNIIINAAHAIGDTIKEGDSKGTITVQTFRHKKMAEIRLMDTGTGIPESIIKKIFDPFFTTKEVGKGTGQGLAISYDVIVNKHNGTLQVESEPGKGTTFIIQLPLDG